jgi:4-diphosphocytidyl-2-C-methyl-D-erythritol kinase
MSILTALAPAKINLGLTVGPVRSSDGRHELVSVMQSVSLADELTLGPAPAGADADTVDCPAVVLRPHENLAAMALSAFRAATGWQAPPVLLAIEKRIPVAAGLGGGSADAACALRLARAASGLGDQELLHTIAQQLGADVPAQIAPGRWLATGAGEVLTELPAPSAALGVLILPGTAALSTAEVYREADRLALAREHSELNLRREQLISALGSGAAVPAASELLHNDLQRAAVSLCPEILQALGEARGAGADHVLVSGSGPTVLGLFWRRAADGLTGPERAQAAARALGGRRPGPVCATPVAASATAVRSPDGPLADRRHGSDAPVRNNPA